MESEQLTLFTQITVFTVEVSNVASGEVFLKLTDTSMEDARVVLGLPIRGDSRPALRLLHSVVDLLVAVGAEIPSEIPDAFNRIYGKYNGQLIVMRVLSNQKYVYPFDYTESEIT